MDNEPDFTPRTLVIGPLGSRSFAVLGFLLSLEEELHLESIDTYGGLSVGAIISLLLMVGYNIRTIMEKALNINVFGCMGDFLSVISNGGGLSSLANKGVLDLNKVRETLNFLVIKKMGYVPTLRVLYNITGKSLVTFSLDIKSNQCSIFSPSGTPDLSCVDAVINAINIPFIFQQNIDSKYIDLYFSNCYPIDYFDDGDNDVLGVYTVTSPERSQFPITQVEPLGFSQLNSYLFRDMSPYIFNLINSVIEQKREDNISKCSNRCKNVRIPVTLTDPLGYSSTINDMGKMIVDGYNIGLKYVDGELDVPKNIQKWKYQYPEYLLAEESGSDSSFDVED